MYVHSRLGPLGNCRGFKPHGNHGEYVRRMSGWERPEWTDELNEAKRRACLLHNLQI